MIRYHLDSKNSASVVMLIFIWLIFFIYTTSAALLFQQFVLPMETSLHAGQGLLSQDSMYFHKVAQNLATLILRDGWSAWTPYPTPSAGGNVAVLSALYVFFGPNPSSVIPINAMLHASGGVVLILIGRGLSSSRAARLGSVLAACLFVGFPSALNWYGQVHKDGYAILGFFLLLYSGVEIIRLDTLTRGVIPLIAAVLGLLFTAFVRTDNLQLFQIMAVGMLVFSISRFYRMGGVFVAQVIYAILIILAATVIQPAHHLEPSVELELPEVGGGNWQWTPTNYLPLSIDNVAKKLSQFRVYMAAYGVSQNAGSMIDLESMPSNVQELVGYLPQAVLVGVFAPFPDVWFSKISLVRMVGVAETVLWYVIFPGVLWLIWHLRRNPVLWWLLGCALALLTVESYITANLGTLHRVRYPFLFVLILLGVIGWMEAVYKYRSKVKKYPTAPRIVK